jgi:FKBP-type peptidyl-prolyl cis-trans isomerases 1
MHSYIKVLALAALGVGLYSCAQEQTVSDRVAEDNIIGAYVKQDSIWKNKKTASGLYINEINKGNGATPAVTDWVLVKFTGKTLEGDYFHTTDTTVFNFLDYNVNYYHIVPDFLYMAGSMPQGFREALLTMKEGGKVDLLIPSYLGFGSYGAVKFGQMPLLPNAYVQANRPVKYQLELVKVVSNPREYDSLLVDSYVKNNTGFTDIKSKAIYLKEIEKGSTASSDTIGNGSKVYVHYAGYFLDGYCFDTNIKTVSDTFAPYAPYNGGSSSSSTSTTTSASGDTLVVTMAASGSGVVTGFEQALRKMTKGAKSEVVFTSTNGYGIAGQASSTDKPSIAPYMPLKFYIVVDRVDNSANSTTKTATAMLPPVLLRKN